MCKTLAFITILCLMASCANEKKQSTISPESKIRLNEHGLVTMPAKLSATRIPMGAQTPKEAAESLFTAYKANDRIAAAKVAADGAVVDLFEMRGIDKISPLKLVSDTVIQYDGGSLELKIVKNASGRFNVSSLVGRAD